MKRTTPVSEFYAVPQELRQRLARLSTESFSRSRQAQRLALRDAEASSDSSDIVEINTDDFRAGRHPAINLVRALRAPTDSTLARHEAYCFVRNAEDRAMWRNLQANVVFAAWGCSLAPRESTLGSIGLPAAAIGLYLYAAMPALDLWRRAESLPGYNATGVRLRGAMHTVFPLALSTVVLLLPQGLSREHGVLLLMGALCVAFSLHVGSVYWSRQT